VPAGRRGAVELGAELADRSLALREDVVRVDRLEVDLPGEEEVAVLEVRHRVEGALERDPHRVLHEPRLQMCVLDDEELVGPLQELVDRGAHRGLDHADEVVRVELPRSADVEGAAAALVVGGERHEVEDPLDALVPGLRQPLGRTSPDETLSARAGIDSGCLDSDHAADAVGGGCGDPDERDHLLGRELAHRRRPPHGPLGRDPRLGPERALAADDVPRDVLRERLHVQRFGADHSFDRLLEQLREAGHVHALLLPREVDRALDLGGHHRLVSLVPDSHGLLHTRDARAREREPDVGRRGLKIGRGA
jgi:hypothetical protein